MPRPEQPMVDMLLARIVTYEHGEQQSIFLKERGGKRGFPILIGTNEAHEIHRVVTRVEPHRPLTHKLLHDALTALGAKLVRVEITALRQSTFFAQLVLEPSGGGAPLLVDARPSDAIALAVRAGCPIRVAADVVAAAAGESSTGPEPTGPSDSPGDDDPPPPPPPPKKRRKKSD